MLFLCYAIMLIFYNWLPDDGPSWPETYRRSFVKLNSSKSVLLFFFFFDGATAPGVCLGPLYNTPPSLSIPCSVSPFVYSHLSQVRGHVIQPSHFWSSSSSSCTQLSVHLFGIAVCCILSIWPSHRILRHFINLTVFSPLIIASNSSFRRILHNSFSFTGTGMTLIQLVGDGRHWCRTLTHARTVRET